MARTEVTTRTLYTFDELSDAAKEKAREWYRQDAIDYGWWDGVYETTNTAGKILGIDMHHKGKKPCIWFSGFSSRGDGACFEGTYQYKKGWRGALLQEFGPGDTLNELLRIGGSLQQAQQPQLYQLVATCTQSGHYNHSGCMRVEVEHSEHRYRDIGDAEDDIRDSLRDFADWIYKSLEAEFDWLNSDEQVDESIKANAYEFTEDGERA